MPRRSALALEVVTKLILLVVIERSTPILVAPRFALPLCKGEGTCSFTISTTP